MFTNISWSNYLLAVLLLLTIYYVFIGIRFYSNDLKQLLNGQRKSGDNLIRQDLRDFSSSNQDNDQIQSAPSPSGYSAFAETEEDTFNDVEQIISRLKETIAVAIEKKHERSILLKLLQSVYKFYPELRYSAFRPAIDELVISECEKKGSIKLSEEDVEMMWNDAV